MSVMNPSELQVHSALEACAGALTHIAEYQLESALGRRLDALGGRKEFLRPDEHEELLALVEFSQRRRVEALEARLALKKLREAFPESVAIR